MRLLSSGVFAASLIVVGAAMAQQSRPPVAPATVAVPLPPAPPARVGRVSLASGHAGFRGAGETSWSEAEINDPVFTGASLRTDPQARAEMRVGADTIDLAGGTEIAIVRANERVAEIAVRHGRIDLDIRRLAAGDSVQIDIARGGVWLLRPGRYDIDAGGPDQPPRVVAFTGAARFAGSGGDIPIKAGDAAVLTAAGPLAATIEPAAGDEFAVWCGERAVDDAQLAAPYFVSRAMTGYAELDAAGNWRPSARYGAVWAPQSLPADWAPYRDGHWRWLAPWGWIWIDAQPWGFATSHYGRWAFADERWVWVPGAISADPVFAPALVAFLGTPGVGLSYADGPGPAVAWFALAPGEIYWPSYTADLDYIRALNRADIADLSAIRTAGDGEPPLEIANARLANRIYASAVPRPVFVGGGAIATALVTIPEQRLRNAPAIMGSPHIGAPTPPAATRVATIPPSRERAPAERVAARAPKGGTWAGVVRVATIRSQNFQRAARLRAGHLRAPAYAAAPPHYAIVLRMARAGHVASRGEARRKEIRQ